MMVFALSTLGAFSTLGADTADGADVADGTSRDLGCADPACATVHAYLLGFTLTCWSRELACTSDPNTPQEPFCQAGKKHLYALIP